MFTLTRRVLAAAGAVAVLAVAAGCSSDSAASSDSGDDGTIAITVGQLPIVDSVPFKFAVDKGYFAAQGISATADFSNPGAMVTNLINGSSQFALGETAIMVEAFDKGLPIRVIGVMTKTTDDPSQDTGTVLVAKDTTVKTPADLNGKTIAVGALNGGGELSLRAALDKAGANSKEVKFIEMPLGDMTAALVGGQVDAISTISPFDTAALDQGATRLMSPGAEAAPHAMQVAVATSAQFQAEHPEAVQGFLKALQQGVEYAAAHPDEVRTTLPAVSPVPENLIAKMQLPVYDASDPRAALVVWTDLMEQYQFVSKPVDLDALMS